MAQSPGTILWTLSIDSNCPLNSCCGLLFSKACILTYISRGKLGYRGVDWFTERQTPHSWLRQATVLYLGYMVRSDSGTFMTEK